MLHSYEYPRPSVTATVFAILNNDWLLTGVRADHVEAYPGKKCVPGGFLNAKTNTFPGETVAQAAVREFKEECGAILNISKLRLFHEHSNPNTDPRAHVVNLCYMIHLEGITPTLWAGDDLKHIEFTRLSKISEEDPENWAFNHFDLIQEAKKYMDWLKKPGF